MARRIGLYARKTRGMPPQHEGGVQAFRDEMQRPWREEEVGRRGVAARYVPWYSFRVIKKGIYTLVLLTLAGAGFWFSFTMALHAGRSSVPSIVGLKLDAAEKTLKEQGFSILLDTALSRPSGRYASGTVVIQEPRAGRAANRGARIHVGISLGTPQIAVPDLAGMNIQEAKFLLMKQHLKVATVARMSWDAAPGSVIAQYPRKGVLLPKDGAVHILLAESRSDRTYVMPSFLGKPFAKVSRILEKSGIAISGLREKSVRFYPDGMILHQFPMPGHPVKPGDVVSFTVNRREADA